MKLKTLLLLIVFVTKFTTAQKTLYLAPLSKSKNIPSGAKYHDKNLSAEERAKDVLRYLSFEEKLALTGGNRMYFKAIERLGLRQIRMADASQGVHLRESLDGKNKISTSFPGMLALASTWNKELSKTFGKNIGEECRVLGIDILLGPGINMQRLSVSGRNFEYFGEDPVLTSRLVSEYIKGLQSQKIIATPKHFICNDQEFCRHITSIDLDERTLREIYLPPWEAAITEADTKALMTAHNNVNGIPCFMNKPLMNDIVRNEYGFNGIAMTDWQNSEYFPSKQYLVTGSGQSLLMPKNKAFTSYVNSYIKRYPDKKPEMEKQLELMVYYNLLPLFEMGIYDRAPIDPNFSDKIKSHKTFARKVAEEAICLLKNENNILPVTKNKKILLTGSEEIHSGSGSGFVEGYDHSGFEKGLKEVYKENITFIENPSDNDITNADVIIYRLNKKGGEGHDVKFESPIDEINELSRIASLNDNVIVIISSCNPMPMNWKDKVKGILWTYYLGQERGNALANIVSGKINPSGKLPFTIEKDFNDSPDPDYNILGGEPYYCGGNHCYKKYFLGQEKDSDSQIVKNIKPHQLIHVPYEEGIFMGYRWYEKNKIAVNYPFGHGLSYTSFKFDNLTLSSLKLDKNEDLTINLTVTNTGEIEGSEVVQLYISDNECSVERPVKELKAFEKVHLKPGETKEISFIVTTRDLSLWSVDEGKWIAENGTFDVLVGSSSEKIHLKENFILQ